MTDFASRLIAWHAGHGRHDLPWQNTRDPYRVWLSEIMLQQTQVDTVIPYYRRFIERFPDVASLAAAAQEDVLALWSGLGYYARARNLHRAAQCVMEQHSGAFPGTAEQLEALPGIGRSTAAAIASFCFGEQVAILDGNVKRVLCRHFGIEGFPGERRVEQHLWALAESLLPETDLDVYPQAQMDLGATVCTRSRPRCDECPVQTSCVAHAQGLQTRLPAPRPRKAIPQRYSEVLLIESGDAVLLEQRPTQGIWGGLFSLPELIEGEDPAQGALRHIGQSLECWQDLPPVQHVFTHFKLSIQAWRGVLAEKMPGVREGSGLRWVLRADFDQVGLPAPIRKLLG